MNGKVLFILLLYTLISKIIELAKELLLTDKGINIIYCTLQHIYIRIVNHISNISYAYFSKSTISYLLL